ncbi:SLATT domain-containing protein [Undibacterium sp.]|uniref:SLATT domain-containing protein n=1 Tax=Undibacterium sp. TaxID=1914977 RepID=UPI00272F1DC9|nr:SLATT domain-containing protein [Undibacterium sp.]MDP1977621.1 SLATT domain-containing protein [Undibacterium sp.]
MTTENIKQPNQLIEEAKSALLREFDQSIAWYTRNIEQRGRWARGLRVLMISFGGMSAIIPTLSQIKICDKFFISPLWTSVFIALTATVFAFEKYYGHSDAWMRFTLAKLELERVKEKFLLTWINFTLTNTTPDVIKMSVDELIRVSTEKHLIINKETLAWTKAFKSGLASSNSTIVAPKP